MSDEKASYKSKILIVDDQKAIHEDFEKILIHTAKMKQKPMLSLRSFLAKKKSANLKMILSWNRHFKEKMRLRPFKKH